MTSDQKHDEVGNKCHQTADESGDKSNGKFPLSFKETLIAISFGALGSLLAQLLRFLCS